MLEVTHKELKILINKHYFLKQPLMIYGGFGIGKSESVKDTAKEIAKEKKKDFVEWNYISEEKKRELIGNTKGKFIFADERIAMQDPSDIKGIPSFVEGFTSWNSPLLFKVLSEEEADGIIFFDEINTASPMMMNACLQIIHDRCVGNLSLSKNVVVFGAGNRGSVDRSATSEIPYPLKDRASEVELLCPDVEAWSQWGMENSHNIDSRILAFLKWRPSAMMRVDFKSKDKPTTPRGWSKTSGLIEGETEEATIEMLVAGRVGKATAIEFDTFIKLHNKVDSKDFLDNPNKVKKVTEIDQKYALISAITEYYKKNKTADIFGKCGKVCLVLEPEFGVLLFRFIKSTDDVFWGKEWGKSPEFTKFALENGKYLL